MQVSSTTDSFANFAASTAPGGTNSSTPAAAAPSAASAAASSSNVSESMFLQLLVAQLKYQDPTSPQDPSAFVGELAQFSQLEQTIGINQNTSTIASDLAPAGATTPPTTSTSTTPAP